MNAQRLQESLAAALANPEAALIEISRLDCDESLAEFVRQSWHILEPGTPLVWNWHLDAICGYLEALATRKIKRLIINVPPGMMKSLLVSVFFPAWVWTKDPAHRFLGVANGDDLAVRDAQRHKWIIESEWYQARWPTALLKDQSGKGLFGNDSRGSRQAVGITANITGKRGDTMLIDDPHDAKKALSDADRTAVLESYDQKLSNRLNSMKDGAIVLIMQRLHESDLTGHLLKKRKQKWTHLVIPMEYDGPRYDAEADIGRPELNDPRRKDGQLLFQDLFPRDAVEAEKEDKGEFGTAGQLQQRPIPIGGGIIKKDKWQLWPKKKALPACFQVFASYDTAFSEEDHKKAAYSARTTWGLFNDEMTGRVAMILLAGWHDRVGYPALKREAKAHYVDFECDRLLIEKKASGISLIQDLRKTRVAGGHRIRVMPFDPKSMDKVARANLATPLFDAGLVYYPDKEWAKRIIDYVAAFPNGEPPSADYTDTVSQAVIYVRRKDWIRTPDEDERDPLPEEHSDEWNEDNHKEAGAAYG